jgi:hypothetical protein
MFRWYDDTNGTRKYKKRVLGKVTDMPLRRDAEKAVADFRANINVEVRVPQTVSELAALSETRTDSRQKSVRND